jgi:hypothetical protein
VTQVGFAHKWICLFATRNHGIKWKRPFPNTIFIRPDMKNDVQLNLVPDRFPEPNGFEIPDSFAPIRLPNSGSTFSQTGRQTNWGKRMPNLLQPARFQGSGSKTPARFGSGRLTATVPG